MGRTSQFVSGVTPAGRWCVAVLFVAMAGHLAAEEIQPAILEVLKKITVRLDRSGYDMRAGFVFKKTKKVEAEKARFERDKDIEIAYIATDVRKMPVTGDSLTVSIYPDWKTYRMTSATVDDERGILICTIEGERLPDCMPVASMTRLQKMNAEQPIYVIGFPLAEALGKETVVHPINATTTVTPATMTGFSAQVNRGALKGEFLVGGTGGPVTDARGQVLGLCLGARGDSKTAELVSAAELEEIAQGGVGKTRFTEGERKNNLISVKATVSLVQLREPLKAFALNLFSKKRTDPEPRTDARGRWTALPGVAALENIMVRDEKFAAYANTEFEVKPDAEYWFQVKFIRADNTVGYSKPAPLVLPSMVPAVAAKKDPNDWLGGGKGGDPQDRAPEIGEKEPGKVPPAAEKKNGAQDPGWLENPQGDVAGKWPKPEITGVTTIKLKLISNEIDVSVLDFPQQAFSPSAPVVFSEDSRFLYMVEASGIVHKLSIPDLHEERRLVINKTSSSLGVCKDGLLVVVDGLQELWVIDEETLSVKRTIPVATYRSFLCTRESSKIYVAEGSEVVCIDAAAGTLVKRVSLNSLKPPKKERDGIGKSITIGINSPILTPDGCYLIFESVGLHRINVTDPELIYEERIAKSNVSGLWGASPDSKTVYGFTTIEEPIRKEPALISISASSLSNQGPAMVRHGNPFFLNNQLKYWKNNDGSVQILSSLGIVEWSFIYPRIFSHANMFFAQSAQFCVSIKREGAVFVNYTRRVKK
jgi:hypothetical protein